MENEEIVFEEENSKEEVIENINTSKDVEEISTEEKKIQNGKVNAFYKAERLKKEQEAYLKGKIDATKVNSFTGKPIKNARDLEILELMHEAEKKGLDPISDGYYRYFEKQEEKEKELEIKNNEKAKLKKQMEDQMQSFEKVIPDVNERNNLLKDKNFKSLFEDLLEKGGDLGKFANLYKDIKRQIEEDARIKIESQKQANPASLINEGMGKNKSIDELSDDEIDALYKKHFKN